MLLQAFGDILAELGGKDHALLAFEDHSRAANSPIRGH